MSTIIHTFDPAKKQSIMVGRVDGDTFKRAVDPKVEYMNIEKGYGIQVDVFNDLKKLNVKYIQIDDGKAKRTTIIDMWTTKVAKDYGHGKQYFMSVAEMDNYVSEKKQLTLL